LYVPILFRAALNHHRVRPGRPGVRGLGTGAAGTVPPAVARALRPGGTGAVLPPRRTMARPLLRDLTTGTCMRPSTRHDQTLY
jgi:hypothetical protein